MKLNRNIKLNSYIIFIGFLFILLPAESQQNTARYLTFQQFIEKFDKNYNSQEKTLRQIIYTQNVQKIKQRNNSWQGVNAFTDWTQQQLANLRNSKLSPTHTNIAAINVFQKFTGRNLQQTQDNPLTFDWRDNDTITQVKNQGKCGSSWAFSTVAFFESESLIVNGADNDTLDLSEQYLISCDQESFGCSGGFLTSSMDLVIDRQGIPLQYKYPYSPYSSQPHDICFRNQLYQIAKQSYRMSYYNLQNKQETIKSILLKKPIAVAVCGKDFSHYSPSSNQQPQRTLQCSPHNSLVDHSVLLIGYTETEWIVKNHWGQDWGLDGYAYISRNESLDCCIGVELHTTGQISENCTVENCQTCVEENTCYNCNFGYWVKHDLDTGAQTCQPCQPENCFECTDYYGQCKFCVQGYAMFWNTGVCAPSTIQNCNYVKDQICGQCHRGYKLSENQHNCVPYCKVQNCIQCALGPCAQCQIGYSLVSGPTQYCKKNDCNIQDCNFCDKNGNCLQCKKSLTLINNTCINECNMDNCTYCEPNSNFCNQCDQGYSFNFFTKTCEQYAIENCGLHMFSKCYQCKEGYQFNEDESMCNQICSVEHCKECEKNDTSICYECSLGYYLQDTGNLTQCLLYPCTITDCLLCDQNGTTCLECQNQYQIFDELNMQCFQNCTLQNCAVCQQNATQCIQCENGFLVQFTSGKCYQNTIQHCTLLGFYNDKLECWDCEGKYIVDARTWQHCILDCLDTRCQVCDMDTLSICEKCIDGYHLHLTNNGSRICILNVPLTPYCQLISQDQKQCYKCQDYYVFNQESLKCQPYTQDCQDQCDMCAPPNSTQTGCRCKDGKAWDIFEEKCKEHTFGDKCLKIGKFGKSTVCYKCQFGYKLFNNFKKCVPVCNVENCKECYEGFDQHGEQYCQECEQGYFKNSSWKCQACPIQNCLQCNALKCQQCKVGYTLSINGKTCEQILCQNGTVFDGAKCSCPLGQYFSTQTNMCISCNQTNCTSCTTSECISCAQGYYLESGNCLLCSILHCKFCSQPQTCQQCKEGYFFEEASLKCLSAGYDDQAVIIVNNMTIRCPPGCLKCNANEVCSLCSTGFALLSNKICVPCQNNCKTCYSNIPKACLSCRGGFYLKGTDCVKCSDENCLACPNSQNVCSSCAKGYFVKNKRCVTCPTNCRTCNQNGQCLKCEDNFALLSNNTCQQCAVNCKACNPNALYECIFQCQQGYFSNNTRCSKCSSNCLNCNSSSICNKCKQGYHLQTINQTNSSNNGNGNNTTIVCALPCQDGCYQCNLQNNTICTKCFAGYKLNTSTQKCGPDLDCNPTKNCSVCPEGYILSNSECKMCNTGDQHCVHCSNTNIKECTKCHTGYYVQNSKCTPCIVACKVCTQSNACQVCSEGYYMVSEEDSITGQCMKCDANCKTCKQKATRCMSCPDKYILSQSHICLRKQRVQMQLVLNIFLNTYTQHAKNIRNALSALLGEAFSGQTKYVIISSLRSGSVVMNAQLAVPDGQSPQTIYNNVRNQLTSGASLGGTQVLSVSQVSLLNQQGGNQIIETHQDFQHKTLIIILCSVIPALIIVFIMIWIARRHHNKYTQSKYTSQWHMPHTIVDDQIQKPGKKRNLDETNQPMDLAHNQTEQNFNQTHPEDSSSLNNNMKKRLAMVREEPTFVQDKLGFKEQKN